MKDSFSCYLRFAELDQPGRWGGRFLLRRFGEVLEYGKKAVSLDLADRGMKGYRHRVLAMGPEPVGEDQAECGWTAEFDI